MFIPPGENLTEGETLQKFATLPKETIVDRWRSAEGRSLLQQWEAQGFTRDGLDALIGRFHGHSDLRGAPLSGKVLEDKDLSSVDFFAADLRNTRLSRSNLQDSWLSHADIRGTRFDFCKLDNALVDDVQFDKGTSFLGVNINAINFNLAAHLQAHALRQQWSSDIERSIGRFAAWAVGINVVFAFFYYFTKSTTANSFLENLYFALVTFTTLGYGDFYPVGALGMIAVVINAILGYITLGLLVAIFSKRLLGW